MMFDSIKCVKKNQEIILIETEKEWKVIETILETLQEEVQKKANKEEE